MFGAGSPKRTMLLGTPLWLSQLVRKLDRAQCKQDHTVVSKYCDAQGKVRFCGGHGLKQTQEYPPGYGKATSALMQAAVITLEDSDEEWDYDVLAQNGDFSSAGREQWADADLDGVGCLVLPQAFAQSTP